MNCSRKDVSTQGIMRFWFTKFLIALFFLSVLLIATQSTSYAWPPVATSISFETEYAWGPSTAWGEKWYKFTISSSWEIGIDLVVPYVSGAENRYDLELYNSDANDPWLDGSYESYGYDENITKTLTSGTYYIKVYTPQAITDGTNNMSRLTVSFAPLNSPPTTPGTISSSNVTFTSAKVSWGASSDPDGDSITYEVEYKKDFSTWTVGTLGSYTTSSTYKDLSNLESDTTYDVRVRAYDGKEYSNWRDQENVIVTPLQQHDPVAFRKSPSNPVDVVVGVSQTFEVGATDENGDLKGGEWQYKIGNGDWQDAGDWDLMYGNSDSASHSHLFTSVDIWYIKAIVYDQRDALDTYTWTVNVEADTGNLKVYSKNENGTTVSGKTLQLYDNSSPWNPIGSAVTTNSSGYYEWNNLDTGTYNVELYDSNDDFWGNGSKAVSAGSTVTLSVQRVFPWLKTLSHSTSPKTVGQNVHIDVTVGNGAGISRNAKVELWIDRDKTSGWDFNEEHGPVSIAAGGIGDFGWDFTPPEIGTYYVKAVVKSNPNGTYIATDTHGWEWSFTALEEPSNYPIKTFLFKDGKEYDLHAMPQGVFWGSPERPNELKNFNAFYLSYHGQEDAIPRVQALSSQIPEELATFVTQVSDWFYVYRRYEKGSDIIFTAPYYRPGLIECSFLFYDQEDRKDMYKQYILNALAMIDSPLDHAYAEMESAEGSYVVQAINKLDASVIGEAIRVLKNTYGIGETVWSGAGNLTLDDISGDTEIISMLSALGQENIRVPIVRTLQILKRFQYKHPDFTNSIDAFNEYEPLINTISSSVYNAHDEAMTELLLRAFLNTSRDAQSRLNLFDAAYDYVKTNDEPNMDPAVKSAIDDLKNSSGKELDTVRTHFYTYLSNVSLEGAVDFVSKLNDATNGGVKKLIGKVATSAISSLYKNGSTTGLKLQSFYKAASSTKALNTFTGVASFISCLDERLDYQKEVSAILTLQEIINRYKSNELYSRLSGDVLNANHYIEFDTGQDLELYLALRLCDRILQQYSPDNIDLALSAVNLAIGIVQAPASAGASIIGPATELGNNFIDVLNTVLFANGIEAIRQEREAIFNEMTNRFYIKDTTASSIAALYEAPSQPDLPTIATPPEQTLEILPIPDQAVAAGETIFIPISVRGLQLGDTPSISYTGFISGSGNSIQYTGIEGDIGEHAISISATSDYSGSSSATFKIEVSGIPELYVAGDETGTFINTTVGTNSILHPFVVENTGSGNLTVNVFVASPFEIVSPQNLTLAAGESTEIIIKFVPTSTVYVKKDVTFASNSGTEIRSVEGTGVSDELPDIQVSGNGYLINNYDMMPDLSNNTIFGNVTIGNSNTNIFAIANNGTGDLTLTGSPCISITGAHATQFSVIQQPSMSVSGGSSTTFSITFQPTTEGLHCATIEISNNDADSDPYQFALCGNGSIVIAPVINEIGDDSTNEGALYIGPTPTLSQGTQPVTWSMVTSPSGMTIDSSTGVVFWSNPTISGSPHTITIRATNSAGSDDESWQLTVTSDVNIPLINSIDPSSGFTGTQITITGSNFGETQGFGYVTFYNGVNATNIASWSDTQIICTVPEGAATGSVTVTTDQGTSNGVIFTVPPITVYTITTTSGYHGSISPSGSVSVGHGENQTFTITPDPGYRVSDVFVDGVSVGAVTTHTFENVIANRTIDASFENKLKGDVDNSGSLDLADAILSLQVVCGIACDNVNSEADVDNNGKIGLPEAIYALQSVAGLKSAQSSNIPPHSTINIPASGSTFNIGQLVDFEGSGSDTDGQVVSYKWSFGDESVGWKQTTSHTYNRPGSYTVTLIVTDDNGATGVDSITVDVETIWYKDADGDGYSDGTTQNSVSRPSSEYYESSELTATSGDLADSDGAIYPGATEICGDGKDNNCNGEVDEGCGTDSVWENGFTISEVASFPVGLSDHTCSRIGDKIYVMGGRKILDPDSIGTNEIYEFDTNNNQLNLLGNTLPYGMLWGMSSAVAGNGKIYLGPAGGPELRNGWGTHSKIVEYDTSTGIAIEKQAGYGTNMWGISMAADINGFIYLFGGHNGSDQNTIYKYDHNSDTMHLVSNLSYNTTGGAAILGANGKIYYFDVGRPGHKITLFDPSNNVTSDVATIPSGFSFVGGAGKAGWADGENIYLLLVDDNENELRLFKFNTQTNEVTDTTQTIPLSISRYSVVKHNDSVYIIGGTDFVNNVISNKIYKLSFSETMSKNLLYLKSTITMIQGESGSQYQEVKSWEQAGYSVTTATFDTTTIDSLLLSNYEVLRINDYWNHDFTSSEGDAIYNWVITGGKLLTDVGWEATVPLVSNFGVESIGVHIWQDYPFHGAPLTFGPVSGPVGSVSKLAVEAIGYPALAPDHSLIVDTTYQGYPVVAHGEFGSGKVVLVLTAAGWSHDATFPGNAYQANIHQENNLEFLDNVIQYLDTN